MKKLKQINPTKAPGNDNINAAVLKETAEEIAQDVTDMFRKSLDETKPSRRLEKVKHYTHTQEG